jgi:uncharacterized protein YdaL
VSALVLYDTTNTFGWLGELYATGAYNLCSHFGTVTAKPISSYLAGEINNYTAVIYQGSTYNEPLPVAFKNDVQTSSTPVIWCGYNIWQLAGTAFTTRYGWDPANSFIYATGPAPGDGRTVDQVQYKGAAPSVTSLSRYAPNYGGILYPTITTATLVNTLATAVLAAGSPPFPDGSTSFPWAIRSANLTYIGEIPFTYMKEEDRYLAFADLLFDVLAPGTALRRRALVRFEDLNAISDPARLKTCADYLASKGIQFGFGLSSFYKDPLGVDNNGTPFQRRIQNASDVVAALKYLQSKGGTLVEHGWTHQWDGGINPYNEVTGDDFEFYRVTENADHTLTFVGPLPDDLDNTYFRGRINKANNDIATAGLGVPHIFEFPHYSAAVQDYKQVTAQNDPSGIGKQFKARWERSLYFSGVLRGATPDYSKVFGQMFPYVITKDVYGIKVLPENLGSIELEPFFQFPLRFPADLINAASKNLVVRDGFAAFYFHPDFVDVSYLQQTVEGILSLGYTFVDPATL